MRKIFLTCESCGQRMQVPRSAIGRKGRCPTCGYVIEIQAPSTATLGTAPEPARAYREANDYSEAFRSQARVVSEEAKAMFGRATDLIYRGQYGEALALFDRLAQMYPGIPEIESARQHCLQGRQRRELDTEGTPTVSVTGDETDADLLGHIRRVVLEKLLSGSNDQIQLQAAQLLARLIGVLDAGTSTARGPSEARRAVPPNAETNGTSAAYSAPESDPYYGASPLESASERGER